MCWKIERVCKYLLLFAVFMMPQGASVASFQIGGWSVTSFRLALMLVMFLMLLSAFRNNGLPLLNAGNKYSISFYFVWVFYAVLSLLWVVDITNWVRQYTYVVTGVVIAVACSIYLKNEDDIYSTLRALHCGIVVQMILGLIEMLTKQYLLRPDDVYVAAYSRGVFGLPMASQGNTNDFATLMYLGLFLSVVFVVCEIGYFKWFYFLCIVSGLILIVVTNSRANYVAVFLALLFALFMMKRSNFWIYAMLLSMVGLVLYWVGDAINLDYYLKVSENMEFGGGSDETRLGLILNGLYFVVRTFGLGVGPGQIESWMQTEAIYYHGAIINMHNYWMEIMTSYGVIIFIGFIWFYIKLMRDMVTDFKSNESPKGRIISLMIACMMAGWVIASVSPSSVIKYDWLWAFWAICIVWQGIVGGKK